MLQLTIWAVESDGSGGETVSHQVHPQQLLGIGAMVGAQRDV